MAILEADYFTDPLCSWSWSNEPVYRKLKEEFGGQIRWTHRMGGLMEKWSEEFYDPTYDLHGGDAEALARHQEEVSLINKMPIDTGFWLEHPPKSTYPACIAVKAVGFQSCDLEDLFLRRVREGFLTEKRRLDDPEELLKLAAEVSGIDVDRMRRDMKSEEVLEAFHRDFEAARNPLPEARDTKVVEGRRRYSFPTVILWNFDGQYKILDGDSTYQEYLGAIKILAPTSERGSHPSVEDFVRKYGRVATKEVVVVCEVSWEEAEAKLGEMVDQGVLIKRPVGHFCMWELKKQFDR